MRRRFAPHQLRHAHAVEMAREGVPLMSSNASSATPTSASPRSICKASTTPRSSTPSTPAARRWSPSIARSGANAATGGGEAGDFLAADPRRGRRPPTGRRATPRMLHPSRSSDPRGVSGRARTREGALTLRVAGLLQAGVCSSAAAAQRSEPVILPGCCPTRRSESSNSTCFPCKHDTSRSASPGSPARSPPSHRCSVADDRPVA